MTDDWFFEMDVEEAQARVPITIFRCYGSFDSGSPQVFDPIARRELDRGAVDVLLDLRGLSLLTSVGIQRITWLFEQLHPEAKGEGKEEVMAGIRSGSYTAPHLKLVRPKKDLFKVFKMTGLDMIIETYKNDKKALKSF